MDVVTWNVNSLKARMPRVLEFLETQQPDALLLQETKTAAADFPAPIAPMSPIVGFGPCRQLLMARSRRAVRRG